MRAWVALVGTMALLPIASACSYASPDAFEEVAWPPSGAIIGSTETFWSGPLEDSVARSLYPRDALIGPGGAIAFPMAGPDVQTGPFRIDDSCGGHFSRHLVGRASTEGPFVMIDEGPVWSLASSPEGILAIHEDEIRVYAWGTWKLVAIVPAPRIAEPHAWRMGHIVSPDGAWLVDRYPTTRIFANSEEIRTVRTVDVDGSIDTIAFAPDSSHLAIVFHDAQSYHLRIEEIESGGVVSITQLPGYYGSLAWAREGLAAIVHPDDSTTAYVRVHLDPVQGGDVVDRDWPGRRPTSLAWSPNESELLISFPASATEATLAFVTATLKTIREEFIRVEPGGTSRFYEDVRAQAPPPTYGTISQEREAPGAPLAAVLVLAAALALRADVSRRG